MEVVYQAVDGETAVLECDSIREGDHGVKVFDSDAGTEEVAYIPYERFYYAVPDFRD